MPDVRELSDTSGPIANIPCSFPTPPPPPTIALTYIHTPPPAPPNPAPILAFLVMTPRGSPSALCHSTLFRAMSLHSSLGELALPLTFAGGLVIVTWLFAIGPDVSGRFASEYTSKLG